MNQLPRASQLHLPGHTLKEGATHKPAMGTAPPAVKGRLKLSVATLTVISGLSIGVVTSWALVTEMRTTAKPEAQIAAAANAIEQEPTPGEAPVVARAPAPVTAVEQKPTASGPPAVAEPSPIPMPAVSAEVVKTGSIKAAPRVSEPGLLPVTAEAVAVKPEAAVVKAEFAAVRSGEAETRPHEPLAAAAAPQTRPTMTSADANGYLAKAEAALRIGDLAVARLFFGRLAEAGDARGAVGMARTYDDSELKKLPVFGLRGERAEVERWQARARELTAKPAYARN
jgi:hypothetical protein